MLLFVVFVIKIDEGGCPEVILCVSCGLPSMLIQHNLIQVKSYFSKVSFRSFSKKNTDVCLRLLINLLMITIPKHRNNTNIYINSKFENLKVPHHKIVQDLFFNHKTESINLVYSKFDCSTRFTKIRLYDPRKSVN